MANIFDILTICLSIILFIINIKKLQDGSRYIVFYLFWFIYVFPVVLDYLVGTPVYSSLSSSAMLYGFVVSYNDELTRILYVFFLIISQALLLKWNVVFTFGKRNIIEKNSNYSDINHFSKLELVAVFFLALITPALCWITGREIITYTFGWRELNIGQMIIEQGNYSIFEKLSYLGVMASSFLLFWKDSETKLLFRIIRSIIAVLLLYSNICIEGKRSILFFALIVCLFIQLYFGRSRYALLKLIISMGLISFVVLITSIYVKTQYRGYSTAESLYTSFRIDLFRDDSVKLVLYSLQGKEIPPLLDYPFQSYYTQICSIFPLDIMHGQGLIEIPSIGFNTYLSCGLSRQNIDTGINFMTTSLADELIANFHLIGILLVAPILVLLSKFIDRQSPFEKILWSSGATLLMFYSLNYIAYYFEAAILIHQYLKRKKNKTIR